MLKKTACRKYIYFGILCLLLAHTESASSNASYVSHVDRATYNQLLQTIGIEPQENLGKLARAIKQRLDQNPNYAGKRAKLIPILRKLGFIDEVRLCKKSYDYVLFRSADYQEMKERLLFLANLWDTGVRFKQVVFLLDTQHPLPFNEKDLVLKETGVSALNQVQAIQALYKTSAVTAKWSDTPVSYFCPEPLISFLPMADGAADLVLWFMLSKPAAGSSILLVSSQPDVPYDDAILRRCSWVKASFETDTIGRGAAEDISIARILASLSRFLWQEDPHTRGLNYSYYCFCQK